MVSLIILSYNTEKLLKDCLLSLQKNLSSEYEIIVVDNASSDGSVKMIQASFPKVKLIENNENAGFAKGCNLGAKEARGEYLFFLNSDITLTTDPIPFFIETIIKDKENGVVGGLLQNTDGTLQRSYGKFYTLKNLFLMLFLGEKHEVRRFNSQVTVKVDWVSGGCLFTRRSLFEKLLGFDEQFFMYIEDMEYCYRVHHAGFSVLVNPEVRVTHLGQGSSSKTFAIVNIFKGLLYFYKKHKSRVEYNVVSLMLRLKAYGSISIGLLKKNAYLVSTYKKALKEL